MIFSMYLQVDDLDRSLSFYRDGLGLEVAWNDDMLAVLRGADDTAANLVLREIPEAAKQRLGQAGVTRIGWQVASLADLDRAEERLARHGAQYQRVDVADGARIVTHDPNGLSVIMFLAVEPSLAGKPPPFMYWYR